jgi:FixJ family two-component response regulator
MRDGAIDFLTKPVDADDLLSAVERARAVETDALRARGEIELIEANLASLTPRERQVLPYVIAGRLNKQIAGTLGTVEKTIKVHRARMMRKLGVRTVQDLVRLAELVGIDPAEAA